MGIIILAVLAGMALPKFINLSKKAKINSDQYVASALSTAIKTKYFSNIASGLDPAAAWPGSNLFSLMEQAPKNATVTSFAQNTNDNVTWRVIVMSGDYDGIVQIFCPHVTWYANDQGGGIIGSDRGTMWYYLYNRDTWTWGGSRVRGDFFQGDDAGH